MSNARITCRSYGAFGFMNPCCYRHVAPDGALGFGNHVALFLAYLGLWKPCRRPLSNAGHSTLLPPLRHGASVRRPLDNHLGHRHSRGTNVNPNVRALSVGCIALLISIGRFSAGAFPLLSTETRLAASGPIALSGNGNFAVIGGQVFGRGSNGWALQQTLLADGPAALSGRTLLLGLSIFIRTNDNWALQTTLPISVPPWAMVVALDGDTAVEALPFGSYDSWFNPRVDIFTRTNGLWSQAARLVGTNYVGVFGASAALQANRLVVGAPSSFYVPTETSAAYVFRRDGTNWAQEAKLTSPSASSNMFGRWVAISGSTIAVANPTGPEHVVLFRRTNNAWTVSQKLSLPAGLPGGQYAPSPIALNGSTLAVLDTAGVVHIFALSGSTWKEQQSLDSGGGYGLGPGLALSTNALLVNVVALGGSYLYEPRLWTWRSEDIGPVGASGAFSASLTNNFLTASGAGADIAGTNDAFRFVYRAWTGDVEVIVKVARINASDPWARGGIMFRGALSSDAPHGFVMLRQGGRTGFQARSQAGGDTTYSSGDWADAPYWLKLSKLGDTITGYGSVNGTSWVAIASAQVRLPEAFYAGVAVISHQPGTLAAVSFEHVDFTTSTFPAAPTGLTAVATGTDQITLTWQDNSLSEAGFRVRRFGSSSDWWTVPPNTTTFTDTNYLYPASFYRYTVQAFAPGGWGGESDSVYAYTWSLPAEWLSRDIGPVQSPGSGILLPPYSPGYSLTGSGSLSGPSPAFQYVYRSWTNDFDFRAYAAFRWNYGPPPLGARAGLMIRPSLDPLAPFVMLSTTVDEGDKFILRTTNGTTTLTAPTTWNSKVRFVRRGNTFSAFHAESGGVV